MAWDKRAPLDVRRQQWQAAVAALPADRFAPYSIEAWLAPFPIGFIGPDDACIAWPAPADGAAPAVPPDATFPRSVPALILGGDLDTITPSADARQLADAWPGSRFVEVAGSAHHTLLNFRSPCAAGIIVRFIATLRPGSTRCAARAGQISIPTVGRFPLTAAGARPARAATAGRLHGGRSRGRLRGRHGDRGRAPAPAPAAGADARPGLRGGTFTPRFGEESVTVRLRGFRFATDVALDGTAQYRFPTETIRATVRVDGPGAADGRLRVTGVWFGFQAPRDRAADPRHARRPAGGAARPGDVSAVSPAAPRAAARGSAARRRSGRARARAS